MKSQTSEHPSVFLSSGHKNWIMDALARESAQALNLKPAFQYLPVSRRELITPSIFKTKFFPKFSDVNVFMHHNTYIEIIRSNNLNNYWNCVFVTHLESKDSDFLQSLKILRSADRILVQNKDTKSILCNLNIEESKIMIAHGAVDRTKYFPSQENENKNNPYVLIVGDCKPRKNPNAIEKVIDSLPDVNFVIHGKNWGEFTTLAAKPRKNLELLDFELARNPYLMRNATTFLSLAYNEGGPIPLLEALASGTPVVATNTGFSSDLIDSTNGVLLPLSPDLSEIKKAIEICISLKSKVQKTDLLYGNWDWRNLGALFYLEKNILQ